MEALAHQILAGLATGGIYASLALALVMIYQATHLVNFAQGEMAMFTTYLAWSLVNAGVPYWAAFVATVALAFVLGALRTPACAIARAVPLRGSLCRVAAEHFAIAADVHLWLGNITADDYTCDTPDGRGRSREEAAARIARIVCADLDMIGADEVTEIASFLACAQVQQIADGLQQVLSSVGGHGSPKSVLAGGGRFLARAAAQKAGLEMVDLAADRGPTRPLLSRCVRRGTPIEPRR